MHVGGQGLGAADSILPALPHVTQLLPQRVLPMAYVVKQKNKGWEEGKINITLLRH